MLVVVDLDKRNDVVFKLHLHEKGWFLMEKSFFLEYPHPFCIGGTYWKITFSSVSHPDFTSAFGPKFVVENLPL